MLILICEPLTVSYNHLLIEYKSLHETGSYDLKNATLSMDKINIDLLKVLFERHKCPKIALIPDFLPSMLWGKRQPQSIGNSTVFYYMMKLKLNTKVVLTPSIWHNNSPNKIPEIQYVEALWDHEIRVKYPTFTKTLSDVEVFIKRTDVKHVKTPTGPSYTWILVDPGKCFYTFLAMKDVTLQPNLVPENFLPIPIEWLGLDNSEAAGFNTHGLYSKIIPNSVFAFISYSIDILSLNNMLSNNYCTSNTLSVKIVAGKATKYWIRELEKMNKRCKIKNDHQPLYINKNTLPASLWKDTYRCVITPPHVNSMAYVMEPLNMNVPIGLVFSSTSSTKLSTELSQNLHPCNMHLPINSIDAIHKLIIPFLMISRNELKDDIVRTSKRVNFGWSETPCKTHRHFHDVPCNEHGAFYPRINASHFSDHSHFFLAICFQFLVKHLMV